MCTAAPRRPLASPAVRTRPLISRRDALMAGTSTMAVATLAALIPANPVFAQTPGAATEPQRFTNAFGSYQFKLGGFDCLSVSDGALTFPAQWYAANAPAVEIASALEARFLPPEHVTNQTTALLVDTGQSLVLIDTGMADHQKALVQIPETASLRQLGRLGAHLRAAGVAPEDIDVVVLTHGHPDHIGGLLDEAGNLAFPNARYAMDERDWAFWTRPLEDLSPVEAGTAALAVKVLPPIADRLDFVQPGQAIVPGIEVAEASGHTPGHMALVISDGNATLLHTCDAAAHYVLSLARPDWFFLGDVDPDLAMATRRRLFDQAAADRTLVFAAHFPFPSLGHVTGYPDRWEWEPIYFRWQY